MCTIKGKCFSEVLNSLIPSIPTISFTLATLLPEMMATNTSLRFASRSKIFLVSDGMIARSGCLQMGVNVPELEEQ